MAQHMGHDPGEQQRTPFFRLLFKGRKRYQNGVFRFFYGFPFKVVTVEDRHVLLLLADGHSGIWVRYGDSSVNALSCTSLF